jgi:hypothetical protein
MNNTRLFLSRFLCIILPSFLTFGCMSKLSNTSESRFSMRDGKVIAVLDFEQEGFLGGEKWGAFAADELTTALFVRNQMKIVDRALVKGKMLEKNATPAAMSIKAIQDLCAGLNADFIVLGKIARLDSETDDPEHSGKIHFQVTFRVLSVKDGSAVGMVMKRITVKGPIPPSISYALYQMAEEVRL